MNTIDIAIVENDEATTLSLSMSLQKYGYNITTTSKNIKDAKNKINTHTPNLIIIDISLESSSDGILLAQEIKQKHNIPFIFLISNSDESIITQAKQTEPYGYILKPFNPSSLQATIQMAIFKYNVESNNKNSINSSKKVNDSNIEKFEKLLYSRRSTDKPVITFGKDYHLNVNAFETFYKGEKLKLTKKENAFLRLLVAKIGQVVSFEQASNYVWEKQEATENSVRTLVWRLRNKLETDIIKNSSGIGYYIEKS